MKYIILISFLITILIVANSCQQDSLGLEKNVLITQLDSNKKDTTNQQITKVPAYIDSLLFYEEWREDTEYPQFPINYETSETSNAIAFVDTSLTPPAVWVDLRIDNKNPNWIYKNLGREFYSGTVQIKLDSLPSVGGFHLNGSENSGYWSEIIKQDAYFSDSTFLSGTQTNFEITFSMLKKGTINASILATVPSGTSDLLNVTVKGYFQIRYPKP
ncbi:MAG: hypothetical protein ABSG15_10465 [FCB group bacterium]|jgi:hypothetical protein